MPQEALWYVDLLVIFRFNFLSIVGLAPTNPKFIPHGNSTSILLIWTAPSPLGDTTGYRISFTAGDRTNGFMDINDIFTNNFTLTNIIKGVKYRMSIAGKSEQQCSIFRSAIYSVWCVFHIYHNYEGESVGGGVDHKEEDNEGSDADEVEAERENNGGRGGSAGVVVAGVLLPLILLAVATIAVVVLLVWRRR